MRLLFVGPPGAGKGTQAAKIAEKLGLAHISTGEMFRYHVEHGTDLGREVEELLRNGAYVSDDITVAMLEDRMAQPDAEQGFILDGFPRTSAQMEALDRLLDGLPIDLAVLLEVEEPRLMERLIGRGRPDDTAETIRSRLDTYRREIEPILRAYSARGRLVTIDGTGRVEEVTERILEALEGAGG